MERVISVEEKIRRAEEVYQKRKQGENRPVAKVTVNDKKDIKLLKKMIIQILVCVVIYLTIYTVQNNQYVFSDDFLNKANEILSYDTNFIELYDMIKSNVISLWNEQIKQNKEEKTEKQQEQEQESPKETEEENNQGAIGGSEEENKEEQVGENIEDNNVENLSEEELAIRKVKETVSFIKPIEGVISSKYGRRDTATGRVPKNHTGTDIAANLGTKIKSATEGEVVLASEEGDYRKAFKNSNW